MIAYVICECKCIDTDYCIKIRDAVYWLFGTTNPPVEGFMAHSSPTSPPLPANAPLPSNTALTERKERITIEEIANRLSIGRLAVYALLERGEIPAIRLGRRWIVTRHAYEQWERTCGIKSDHPAVQSSYGHL